MDSSVQTNAPVHEKVLFSSVENPNDYLKNIITSIPCACFDIELSRNYDMTLISAEIEDWETNAISSRL